MAEVKEPQFSTLAERIAALNRQPNFQSPAPTAGTRPPPPPPPVNKPPTPQPTPAPRPTPPDRSLTVPQTPSLPPRPARPSTQAGNGQNLAPPPPSRTSTQPAPSPALPPRRPSSQNLSRRRNSGSSDVSQLSALSLTSAGSERSARKLPPPLDQADLPPLPPKRPKEKEGRETGAGAHTQRTQTQRTPSLPTRPDPPRPSLPPRLPSRPGRPPTAEQQTAQPPTPALPTRRLPPPPPPSTSSHRPKSALASGFSNGSKADDEPPPIPLSSRPTFAEIDAASNRAATAAAARPASAAGVTGAASCLVCRDFSGPDSVAAQHPAHTLPRQDPVGYLAHVLCGPFSSATDKARAIFTWCHHNIAYDVEGFFGGCIPRGQSPADTIFSGKAVCEGYAKVYEAIAARAGLGCVVVGGHGKGFGFAPLRPGQRPPPRDPSGHAWNAVRLDGGEWKLIDACWGAGAVGEGTYTKRFAPEMFYLSNHLFGLKHFPADARHFYLSAEHPTPTWDEYIVGPLGGREQATWYGNATQEGLCEFTFSPREKQLSVRSGSGDPVRFQFSKVCEHWNPVKNGQGPSYLLMMKIHGLDGRKEDLVPLDHDGFWWWVDIPARDLGAPGQTISLYGLDTLDGRPARGVTKEEFLRKKGRCGMSWVGIAAWELV